MHSPGINGEGELRGQPANPGSPEKMAVKTECVSLLHCALSLAAKCIVIGPVGNGRTTDGQAVSEPYYSQRVRSVCISLSAFFIVIVFSSR